MNQYPEIQQNVQQQSQATQLLHCQPAQAKPEQFVCTTESAIASPLGQLDTVTLVKTGGVPTAIILAIAVLILALAEYNKVFVLMMPQKQDNKTE
ncbi:hypothetical protein H6F50_07065 [Coleofasciculus sp. FACHB-712]|uniref:hypothetical protein n=1 Tax=Coleofasciculus sp. FACHB-712 TaxID=2692789 RepID=UPI0016841D24|nr:hypothetical protein [Coleofasciculus sp. FACHB-712]MBD1942120.1 hypothetical protein [Coleofasciculus sp. FACHB-712]